MQNIILSKFCYYVVRFYELKRPKKPKLLRKLHTSWHKHTREDNGKSLIILLIAPVFDVIWVNPTEFPTECP